MSQDLDSDVSTDPWYVLVDTSDQCVQKHEGTDALASLLPQEYQHGGKGLPHPASNGSRGYEPSSDEIFRAWLLGRSARSCVDYDESLQHVPKIWTYPQQTRQLLATGCALSCHHLHRRCVARSTIPGVDYAQRALKLTVSLDTSVALHLLRMNPRSDENCTLSLSENLLDLLCVVAAVSALIQ